MTTSNQLPTTKTLGTVTFSTCGQSRQPLFRVNPDIPIESALEHASSLLACIHELSLDSALGDARKQSMWAVHHLSDMARAILEDALSGSAAEHLPTDTVQLCT
jgi:hypothetical protein